MWFLPEPCGACVCGWTAVKVAFSNSQTVYAGMRLNWDDSYGESVSSWAPARAVTQRDSDRVRTILFSKEVHLISIINHLFLFLTLIHVCTLPVMVNALTFTRTCLCFFYWRALKCSQGQASYPTELIGTVVKVWHESRFVFTNAKKNLWSCNSLGPLKRWQR